jgi:hypothetical protein
VSPTIFRAGGLRFFFFSLEERRPHVHVEGARGEAKFWLEPAIEQAENHGLNRRELSLARRLIRERFDEIRAAWSEHFGS